MTESLEKFKDELKKLFRADDKDLNWGIYQIMNQKNEEIDIFISKELPKIVNEKILSLKSNFGENIEKELETLKKSLEDAGVNPENAPKYQELLKRKKENKSVKDFEDSIYNHLITFFSRYYQDGDFISQFFFKEGTYLIPYDGSEVDLHWVTKDMYFIKTSDQYSRFTFKAGDMNVLLKMVSAEEEKGNVKGKTPYFDFENIAINGNEVEVGLKKIAETDEIKALGKNKTERQNVLNEKIKQEVEKEINIKVDIKNIEKFQRKYVEDFFIHKDLKGFLTNQMKFYLNQEIVDVDSYINDDGSFNEDSKIIAKVFKDICLDIIEKLSLLEELKKKIWEKKKFVLESNYVITLDKIAEYCGEEFLEQITNEIISNKEQLNEWKELFDIDAKNKKDLIVSSEQKEIKENYEEKDKAEWKKLPIDTKHFSEEFKWNLLSKIEKIDEKLNGVLMHSENWQALNLLQEKYRGKVQCCYIDPPFNTGTDFAYKDGFQDSSWINLIIDRLYYINNLIKKDGSFYLHLDENANYLGRILLENLSFHSIKEIIFNTNATKDEEADLFGYKSFGKNYILKHNMIYYCSFIESKFNKLWKPNRNTSNLNLGWLDLIAKPKENLEKHDKLEHYNYFIESWKQNKFDLEQINIDEKIFPISDLWTDIYSFTQSEMRVSENISFITQKPENLMRRIIQTSSDSNDLICDFFMGSGSTISTAKKLNRKFLGIEAGEHFYQTYFEFNDKNELIRKLGVLGRIKIVSFGDIKFKALDKERRSHLSKAINWQGGGFFKYHELEQYEDALENIQFKQSKLDFEALQEKGKLLSYILDQGIDKNKSKNFLGVDTEDEFLDLKIKILNNDGTTRLQNVDLIETFIYLIGLEIDEMKLIKKHKPYYVIKGKFNENPTIIIWRKPNKDEKEQELDRDVINSFLQEKTYKEIFVNSDCLIQNYKNIYDEMRKRLW